jgi:hypothetical protein
MNEDNSGSRSRRIRSAAREMVVSVIRTTPAPTLRPRPLLSRRSTSGAPPSWFRPPPKDCRASSLTLPKDRDWSQTSHFRWFDNPTRSESTTPSTCWSTEARTCGRSPSPIGKSSSRRWSASEASGSCYRSTPTRTYSGEFARWGWRVSSRNDSPRPTGRAGQRIG